VTVLLKAPPGILYSSFLAAAEPGFEPPDSEVGFGEGDVDGVLESLVDVEGDDALFSPPEFL
jgi:hypothetical protein